MLTETCAILYVIEVTDLEARGTFSDPAVYGPWAAPYFATEPLRKILTSYIDAHGDPAEYKLGLISSLPGTTQWDEIRYCFPGGRIQVSLLRKRVSVEQYRYQMQFVKEP